jgi:hypothetical protein
MTLTPLAELEDFQLVYSDQDCRGWPVLDAAGRQVGTVREMLVDTVGERVAALVLDSGAQVLAGSVTFNGGRVLLGQSERAC